MTKQQFIISSRDNLVTAFRFAESLGYGKAYIVEVKPLTRTLQQNRLMWKILQQLADQVVWYGNKLTKENWKDMITAGLKSQDVVPGINGGFVVLGDSTRKMSVKELNEVIELAYAFGAQHGVVFND